MSRGVIYVFLPYEGVWKCWYGSVHVSHTYGLLPICLYFDCPSLACLFINYNCCLYGMFVPSPTSAGDDLLRSKSLDRDSYNSGDHFNRIDWLGLDNNFGVGLPIASKNAQGWHYKQRLLANPMVKPTAEHIQAATEMFQLLLRIRQVQDPTVAGGTPRSQTPRQTLQQIREVEALILESISGVQSSSDILFMAPAWLLQATPYPHCLTLSPQVLVPTLPAVQPRGCTAPDVLHQYRA